MARGGPDYGGMVGSRIPSGWIRLEAGHYLSTNHDGEVWRDARDLWRYGSLTRHHQVLDVKRAAAVADAKKK